jgi:hypothetical protein
LVYFVAVWYILWPFGIFCGHLAYFVAIWNILWPFGIHYIWFFGIFYGHLVYFMALFQVLVYCTKKNLANPDVNDMPRT